MNAPKGTTHSDILRQIKDLYELPTMGDYGGKITKEEYMSKKDILPKDLQWCSYILWKVSSM